MAEHTTVVAKIWEPLVFEINPPTLSSFYGDHFPSHKLYYSIHLDFHPKAFSPIELLTQGRPLPKPPPNLEPIATFVSLILLFKGILNI